MRLTLRTLLAYLDDTLDPRDSRSIGRKINESEDVPELVERIRKITRRRGLNTPVAGEGDAADANTIAEYLDNELNAADIQKLEEAALASDIQLAEVASCHQILTLVLSEPARVPPTAHTRMYELVTGAESIPDREPSAKPVVASIDPARTELTSGAVPVASDQAGDSSTGVRLLITAAVMLVVLTALIAIALPRPNSTVNPDPLRAVLAKGFALKPTEPERIVIVAPKPETKPEPIAKLDPMPEPMPTPEPMPMPMPVKPEPMPMPLPRPLVQPAEKPSPVRNEIGSFRNADSVLFMRPIDAPPNAWVKSPRAVPIIYTTDILMSLPGCLNEIQLRSGIKVLLFGNVPGWIDLPIFQSTVQFHIPPTGFDADLTLHAGRVVIGGGTPGKPSKVRLRVLDLAWDLTLTNELTEIVADRVQVFPLNAKFAPKGGGEPAQTELSIGIWQGSATVKVGTRESAILAAPTLLVWDNKGLGMTDPKKLDQPSPIWMKTPPNSAWSTSVQSTMSAFAKKVWMGNENPSLQLTEMVFAERTSEPQRVTGVLGLQSLGEIGQVTAALNDNAHPDSRFYAILALRHWAASSAGREQELYQLLIDKRGFPADQARDFVSLLHDFTEAEANASDTYARLFELMAGDRLPLRELAFFHLRNLDPEAIRDPQFQFDAGAPDEFRAKVLANWRKRIPEGRVAPRTAVPPMPMPTPKPTPAPAPTPMPPAKPMPATLPAPKLTPMPKP